MAAVRNVHVKNLRLSPRRPPYPVENKRLKFFSNDAIKKLLNVNEQALKVEDF